jgi:hypothetical protein
VVSPPPSPLPCASGAERGREDRCGPAALTPTLTTDEGGRLGALGGLTAASGGRGGCRFLLLLPLPRVPRQRCPECGQRQDSPVKVEAAPAAADAADPQVVLWAAALVLAVPAVALPPVRSAS